MNVYKELEEIEVLRQRVKQNQDQVLDIYEPKNETMQKLLKEMNDLLEEVDQVENEMEQLMKQL
jgi:precorrin-3B methylase